MALLNAAYTRLLGVRSSGLTLRALQEVRYDLLVAADVLAELDRQALHRHRLAIWEDIQDLAKRPPRVQDWESDL